MKQFILLATFLVCACVEKQNEMQLPTEGFKQEVVFSKNKYQQNLCGEGVEVKHRKFETADFDNDGIADVFHFRYCQKEKYNNERYVFELAMTSKAIPIILHEHRDMEANSYRSLKTETTSGGYKIKILKKESTYSLVETETQSMADISEYKVFKFSADGVKELISYSIADTSVRIPEAIRGDEKYFVETGGDLRLNSEKIDFNSSFSKSCADKELKVLELIYDEQISSYKASKEHCLANIYAQ